MNDVIINDLKTRYGMCCNKITPVTGGLLNLKWRVSTEKGEILVKQYSMKRFSRERIDKINTALKRQIILQKNGVRCPVIWQSKGNIIQWADDKTAYMVMDFCQGKLKDSRTITLMQMKSLGDACAVMYLEFKRHEPGSSYKLPVYGGYNMDLLWDFYKSSQIGLSQNVNMNYHKVLLKMEPILKQLNNKFFDEFPKGFAHEDFQPGNILFEGESVSAIIDFDRNCYSYIWHDIGRAIMSFAFDDNVLNIEKVNAFIEGYSQHSELTLMNVIDAIKLTWCIETPWWIQPEFFDICDEVPKRFRDEMIWLTEHWFELDTMLL